MKKKISRGMVVRPYVNGLSEKIARIMKNWRVSTALRPPFHTQKTPHQTQEQGGTQGKNCEEKYVGETISS